jgi:hypothetical protein
MSSFFGKLKNASVGNSSRQPQLYANRSYRQGPSSPSTLTGKKDAAASNQTPLERMLLNAGPIRGDGSDKFFGMENVVAPNSLTQLMLIFSASSSEIPGWQRSQNRVLHG